MPKLSLAFLVLLVIGAGCDASTAPAGADNLASARALWDGQHLQAYSYKVSRNCECVLGGREMTVSVSNGSVVSAGYVDSGSAVEPSLLTYVLTVPDLFDLIQDALDRKAVYLAVRYDPIYGYPTRIDIDYSADAVDDEVSMSARELTIQ